MSGGGGTIVSHNLLSSNYISSSLAGAYVLTVNMQVNPSVPNADYDARVTIRNNGTTLGELVIGSPGDSDGIGTKRSTTSRSFFISNASNINISHTFSNTGTSTTLAALDMVLFGGF